MSIKNKFKLLSIIITFCMMMTILPFIALADEVTGNWTDGLVAIDHDPDNDGVLEFNFDGGDGSEANPFQISTPEQLAQLAVNVMTDTPYTMNGYRYAGQYFELTADIDLAGKEWTPIGKDSYQPFMGVFDGNDHTISNIYINSDVDDENLGLFGYISTDGSNGGVIQYLRIESGTITSQGRYSALGGVVGEINGGTVSECYNNSRITCNDHSSVGGITGLISGNGAVKYCDNYGSIEAGSDCSVGGIAGRSNGNTSYCTNIASVTGVDSSTTETMFVGGIIGWLGQDSIVKYCSNNGSYGSTISGGNAARVGGVVGYSSDGVVTSCSSEDGMIKCGTSNTNGSIPYAGGVVGYTDGNIDDCYNTSSIAGGAYADIGGVTGFIGNAAEVYNCYNLGIIMTDSDNVNLGGIAGVNKVLNNKVVNCFNKSTVAGTGANTYVGGIVGYNKSQILNCYNKGNSIAGGTGSYAGGIAGYNYGGTLKNTYYLNTAAMKGRGNSADPATPNGTVMALTETQMQGTEAVDIQFYNSTITTTTTGAIQNALLLALREGRNVYSDASKLTGWIKDIDEYPKLSNDYVETYTVTFDSQGGSTVDSITAEYNTLIGAPDLPTKEGFIFQGWFIDSDCLTAWDFDTNKVTEDITLYAGWEKVFFTVSFLDWDGTLLKEEEVEYGGSSTAPDDPEREGYTFTGWDKDFSNVTSDLQVGAEYDINIL